MLVVVDSAPEKVVRPDAVRRAVGLTPRGFNTVLDRICNRGFMAFEPGGVLTITFGGMRALKGVST